MQKKKPFSTSSSRNSINRNCCIFPKALFRKQGSLIILNSFFLCFLDHNTNAHCVSRIKNWKITCDRYRREFTCPSCRNTLPSVNQIIIDIIKDIQNIPKTATIQIQKIWRGYKVRKNLES